MRARPTRKTALDVYRYIIELERTDSFIDDEVVCIEDAKEGWWAH